MQQLFTIPGQAIQNWADASPNAVALKAPGAKDISFIQLARQIKGTVEQLSALGYGAESRLAVVLPQGILLATALLSLSACCPVLPVNAAWLALEQSAIFKKAGISALITIPNFAESARSAAAELSLPVIELFPPVAQCLRDSSTSLAVPPASLTPPPCSLIH